MSMILSSSKIIQRYTKKPQIDKSMKQLPQGVYSIKDPFFYKSRKPVTVEIL